MNRSNTLHRWFAWLAVVFFAVGFPLEIFCVDDDAFRSGRKEEYKESGVSLRSLRGLVSMPPPVPFSTTIQRGDERFSAVDIHSCWLQKQVIGYLAGNGMTMTIYRPAFAPPVKFKPLVRHYHKEEVFTSWLSEQECPDFSNEKNRREWIAYCMEREGKETSEFTFLMEDEKCIRFYTLSRPPEKGSVWIFAVFTVRANSKNEKKLEKALRSISSSFQTWPVATSSSAMKTKNEKAASSPEKTAEDDERKNSRQRAIDSIQSLKDWWYQDTKHFIVVSNIRRRKDIKIIVDEAELIRSAYEKLLPAPKPVKAVSVIRVFDDRDQYNAYVGWQMDWSIGVWMAHKQELVFFIPYEDMKDKKNRTDTMRKTLRHELLHQYLFYALEYETAPPWFNEGLAQFMEYMEFKGKDKVLFRVDKELNLRIQKVLDSHLMKINTLRNMSYKTFQKNYKRTYDVVLSVMYFMLKGAADYTETSSYAQIPTRYFQTLAKTKNQKKADDAAWTGIDAEKFDRDVKDFWNGKGFKKTTDDMTFGALPGSDTLNKENTKDKK